MFGKSPLRCWVCDRKATRELPVPVFEKPEEFKVEYICADDKCLQHTYAVIRIRQLSGNNQAYRGNTRELDNWQDEVARLVNDGVDKSLDSMTSKPVHHRRRKDDLTIIDYFMASLRNCKTDEERGAKLLALDHQELRMLNQESDEIYPDLYHRAARTVPDTLEEEYGLTKEQIDWLMMVELSRKGRD